MISINLPAPGSNAPITAAVITACVAVVALFITATLTLRAHRLAQRGEAWKRFQFGVESVTDSSNAARREAGWLILVEVATTSLASRRDRAMMAQTVVQLRARQTEGKRHRR